MSVIVFSSAIGPVAVDCVLSEKHESDIEVTEIPIESGARVTDHAFILPKRVSLDVATSGAAEAYNRLVAFQESRVPFTLVTGLSVYTNMLIKRLSAQRDPEFSRVLRCTAEIQEVILVETSTVASPEQGGAAGARNGQSPSKGKAKGATTADRASGTEMRGDTGTSTVPAGRDSSLLYQLKGGAK